MMIKKKLNSLLLMIRWRLGLVRTDKASVVKEYLKKSEQPEKKDTHG